MATKPPTLLRRRKATACPFCKTKKEPDYKDYKELEKYISDRSKIFPSMKTGLCSKHQRHLSKEIKRARYLGLLSFTSGI